MYMTAQYAYQRLISQQFQIPLKVTNYSNTRYTKVWKKTSIRKTTSLPLIYLNIQQRGLGEML